MQILQLLSKITAQEQPQRVANSSLLNNKQADKDHKVKSKNIVVLNNCGFRRSHLKQVEQSKLNCENLYVVNFASFNKGQQSIHSTKMKKEDNIACGLGIGQKSDSGKVLPITDSSANYSDVQCPKIDKKEKTKTISRFKELLRWSAAVKAEKGGKYIGRKVLLFKNRTALKAVPDNNQLNDESSKMSFRWEVERCSTNSLSVYSAISAAKDERKLSEDRYSINSTPSHVRDKWVAGSGNWITTDSEFVVLEL